MSKHIFEFPTPEKAKQFASEVMDAVVSHRVVDVRANKEELEGIRFLAKFYQGKEFPSPNGTKQHSSNGEKKAP